MDDLVQCMGCGMHVPRTSTELTGNGARCASCTREAGLAAALGHHRPEGDHHSRDDLTQMAARERKLAGLCLVVAPLLVLFAIWCATLAPQLTLLPDGWGRDHRPGWAVLSAGLAVGLAMTARHKRRQARLYEAAAQEKPQDWPPSPDPS